MGAAASSSSSSSSSCKKHEVFLSFRGEDTRRSFTSHLHTALCLKGIQTYIDYELPKGDDISQSLIHAIHQSSLSVVIFSQNYASSKWCLNELIEILHCKQHEKQHVIPVFYQVDPSHVRNQRGTYEEAFAQHMEKYSEKVVVEWRKALFETANLAGWDSSNFRDEAEMIQYIVNDIMIKLNDGSSSISLANNTVGIEENSDHIELFLESFMTIGIWGMGGIGKTTMAKVVFAKFQSQFDSCCFLENLREESEKHGLKYIRDKLFLELSNGVSLQRLGGRKVLIVLDDVSSTRQLDYLESEAPALGYGSKVIITSRDRHVLDGRVEKIHMAKALNRNHALELFNLKAFGKYGYKCEYEEVVERAIAYAQGNPLALTILGSFLHSKVVKEWESALRKLERTIHQDIQAVLKLSYDGLDDEEKEIFLDIACFFKGEGIRTVTEKLESFGFHVSIGLRTLLDKALISVHHEIHMHDLIQSMAFEIVRQECKNNPGGRSRLWNADEIYDVLKHDRGNDAIQGISLDLSQIRDLQLSADAFRKMTNLRFLRFYSPKDKRSCTVSLPSGLESFNNSMRYLQWGNFPLKSLPLSCCAEKIVKLHMTNSHLGKLWDGVQNLVNLREMNLSGSKQLKELPDLSTAQNLERVHLGQCKRLRHFNPSILSLPRLRDVDLRGCEKLKCLKAESQSKSISRLCVNGCYGLKEFSFSTLGNIYSLGFEKTGVEILDFSIGPMEKLQRLSLKGSKLKNLPIKEICCMRSLEVIDLYDCGDVIDKTKLHTLFDALLSLKMIVLNGTCKLNELPNNVKNLSMLQSLYVSSCRDLQSLPELPTSIEELHASDCTSLKTLQLTSYIGSSLNYLRNLQKLNLDGCEQLFELPEFIDSLSSLSSLSLSGSNIESLPANIKHLTKLKYIYLCDCRRLRSLTVLPPFMKSVHANGCISLEIVPISTPFAPQLCFLFLKYCLKLESNFLSCVVDSAYFTLKRLAYTKQRGGVCYPGSKVPDWFTFQGIGSSNYITIEVPSSTNNLVGFIFCSVLSHHPPGNLQCQFYYEGKKRKCSQFHMIMGNLDSHHVFLWSNDPDIFIYFHDEMDDRYTSCRPKVSFEFSFVTYNKIVDSVTEVKKEVVDGVIEACGVCPIYASEYPNFIQQMGLESNLALGAQKEACHDFNENSFHRMLNNASLSLKQEKCVYSEGSSIPDWFTYKSSTSRYGSLRVRVQLATDFDNLKGYIFCFVIPHLSSKERDQSHSSCNCRSYDRSDDRRRRYHGFRLKGPSGWHYSLEKLNSDDTFIWYDPLYCERILQKLRKWGKGYEEDLEFEFKFGHGEIHEWGVYIRDCFIKECGVRPIYVSEYTKFLQQKRKQLKVSTQRKRHLNLDDGQFQLYPTKKLKESSVCHSIPLDSESKTSHDVDKMLLMLSKLNLESAKNHTHP